jgi:hypothetical protein
LPGGVPREYGCPLGTVFDIGSGSGVDGKCTDPEAVPECASYYGDADLGDVARSGADFGPVGESEDRFRPRPTSPRKPVTRNQNALTRTGAAPSIRGDISREKSRPAPASLQQIVDSSPPRAARPPPPRPQALRPSSQRTGQFRPREEERLPVTPSPGRWVNCKTGSGDLQLSSRLQQLTIQSLPETTQRPAPARLQVPKPKPCRRYV